MKLTDFYYDLITERPKPERHKVRPFLQINNHKYRIYSTEEQYNKRNGYLPEISRQMINRIDPSQDYAEGVPNTVIRKSIKNHIEKIIQSFKERNFSGRDKRIIFVEGILEDKTRPSDKYYIEYVLEYYPLKYDTELIIITSALSQKGTFLKSIKRNDPRVVLVESIDFKSLDLVLL